mmetsp:Transcript_3360/g.5978  ORF Transcript_3360/g.5978 Transcript_3360/m.5978 type:complete len:246 (-) Transcript_3360:341-1078(-)|eukprot:CAMPEP_0201611202 /NCGR_PEP_ID=MMETSP0492-20130828/19410_1 /ASSEMBLY_ACC=CAM_ASM_000837 /TAXON_ID=420259 /ORGANISM="Thalassiosira gravida, Strain GMp14c1" /LENGTH=245 /DNA_ID=CAMNT_0048077307 /DNA_START=74 /DNA_END=811 /DNA_ORIENTATION=+
MGKAKILEAMVDPTAWMIDNDISDFLRVQQTSVLYMCMLGYTFLHGSKVFAAAPKNASFSYKLVSMIFACTGGGILVPLFINKIPVPIANDAYPIAIMISFSIHYYFPVVWEVVTLVPWVKACIIVLYECVRAKVVLTFTIAASAAIAPSLFSFPLFGPIMCGTISGCGGAFLPMNKGLDPILKGLGYPMITACVGSTLVHLFMNTSMSEGVIGKKEKAHFHLVVMFITIGLVNGLGLKAKVKKD